MEPDAKPLGQDNLMNNSKAFEDNKFESLPKFEESARQNVVQK